MTAKTATFTVMRARGHQGVKWLHRAYSLCDYSIPHWVAYLLAADKYSGPLASRLIGVNQPVIRTRNAFSTLRLTQWKRNKKVSFVMICSPIRGALDGARHHGLCVTHRCREGRYQQSRGEQVGHDHQLYYSMSHLQRRDHRGRIGLRDAEPLCQGGSQAGGGITEGAQGRQQHREEDVHPLVGCALAHAAQAPLDHRERSGFQGGQDEAQAIFRRRKRTVFVDRETVGGPRCPIEAPRGEMRVERRLEGRDSLLTGCEFCAFS